MQIEELDATEILPGLSLGGNLGPADLRRRFDLVVCLSYRSNSKWGPGAAFVWFPIDDGATDDETTIRSIASMVARMVSNGKRVFVHCDQGLNRSSLVVAQTMKCLGYTADEAIARIREKRSPMALFNNDFERWLRSEA